MYCEVCVHVCLCIYVCACVCCLHMCGCVYVCNVCICVHVCVMCADVCAHVRVHAHMRSVAVCVCARVHVRVCMYVRACLWILSLRCSVRTTAGTCSGYTGSCLVVMVAVPALLGGPWLLGTRREWQMPRSAVGVEPLPSAHARPSAKGPSALPEPKAGRVKVAQPCGPDADGHVHVLRGRVTPAPN